MQSELSQKELWGQYLFSLRSYTPIPLLFLMFLLSSPTVGSATLGLMFIVGGELIRIYSVAFIGMISRTRKGSLGAKLVQSGPFKIVRNPLYVGNFFIANGFAVFSGSLMAVLVMAVCFFAQYYFIIAYEERLLLSQFGSEYNDYRRSTPQWFPEKLPRLSELEWPQEFSMSLQSEKRTLSAILVLIIAFVYTA